MAILLVIAALILVAIILLVVRNTGMNRRASSVPERFKNVGPGEPRPKEPRTPGLD